MRKAILMMILAVVSSSAAADWVQITGDDTSFTAYADPASIHRAGNRVKMRSLLDFKTADKLGSTPYMSQIEQQEYDCKKEQMRTLALNFYSGNMGEGETVYSDTDPDKWRRIIPDSIDEDLWETACRKPHR